MQSDIDELLEWLQDTRNCYLVPEPFPCDRRQRLADANRVAAWIAAVEELRDTAILWAAISATQREKTVAERH